MLCWYRYAICSRIGGRPVAEQQAQQVAIVGDQHTALQRIEGSCMLNFQLVAAQSPTQLGLEQGYELLPIEDRAHHPAGRWKSLMVLAADLPRRSAHRTVERLAHPELAQSQVPAAGGHLGEQRVSCLEIAGGKLVHSELRSHMAVVKLAQYRIPVNSPIALVDQHLRPGLPGLRHVQVIPRSVALVCPGAPRMHLVVERDHRRQVGVCKDSYTRRSFPAAARQALYMTDPDG